MNIDDQGASLAAGQPLAPPSKSEAASHAAPTFTPGPWFVGPYYKSDVASREGRVCECRPFESPRAIANAHLIAAAPELYEALKETLDACAAAMRVVADLDMAERLGWSAEQKQQRFVDELKFVGVKDGFGVRAKSALAKAEGRS